MSSMNNQNRIIEMENGNIVKVLFKFGVPTMIGMMITSFYNLVDAYFVGYLGTNQMAAVSLVFPITIIITGLGVLFGNGTGSNIARALGNKDYEKVSKYASTAIISGTVIGAIVVSAMLIGMNPLLHFLGANEETFGYAKSYGTIIISGLVFSTYNIICNNIIVSEGASKFSMCGLILGGVLNMILDPIFVFIFHMGVEGVAYATLIASMVSTILYTFYLLSKRSCLNFSITHFTFSKEIYANIFKIGIPILAFQLLMCFSLSFTNMIALQYGNHTIAAIGIVNRILTLEMMAVFGFLKGYQPLVGYNYGAGKEERVKELTRKASWITTGFCVLFNSGCILFARDIIKLFNKDSASVIAFGTVLLRVDSITYITLGFQLVYASYFLATGKVKEGGILSIVRQGLIYIPLLFLLSITFGKTGLILAQPVADMITCFVVWFICKKANLFYSKKTVVLT